MKLNRTYFILGAAILLLLVGCRDEDMSMEINSEEAETEGEVETEQEEVIEIFDFYLDSEGSFYSLADFVVLSNNEGETLFDTFGLDLDIEVEFLLDANEIVNATFGSIKDDEVFIVSYSDIPSASRFNLLRDWDIDPCFKSSPVDFAGATLYVTDLEGFNESIDPFLSGWSDFKNDTLVLKGFLSKVNPKTSYQIAIKEEESSDFKSIITPETEWAWDFETQSMSHTLSFNDFSETDVYEIDINRTDKWSAEVKVCNAGDSYIATQSQKSYSEIEAGEKLFVYLNHELELSKLKLNLRGLVFPSLYSYNWIYDHIPSEIILDEDIDPTFVKLNNDEYHILNTFDYNINVMNYQYGGSKDWTIISKGGENVRFVKPQLPSQLYDAVEGLHELLNNPSIAINSMYRTGEIVDDISKIHKSVIPRNRNNDPDFNYSSKVTRVTF